MAYKYQMGPAVMSGSLIQEGAIEGTSVSTTTGNIESGGTVSGSSNLLIGGTVKLQGVADAALDVAADSFFYKDATDDLMKRDSMADYATAIAGSGLAATSGVLSVDLNEAAAAVVDLAADSFTFIDAGDSNSVKKDSYVDYATAAAGDGLKAVAGAFALDLNELTAGAIAAADSFAIIDADDSNATKKESVADLATLFAGNGLAASSAVLAVNVSGAMVITSDNVSISGSIAGAGLGYVGNATGLDALELDISEFSEVAPASNDAFLTLDSNNSTEQLCTVDALASLYAGAGLAATSAVLAVVNATNGGLSIFANDMAVSLVDLIDANDSDGSKKESIADLVTAMAGTGLTAAAGVLSLSSTGGVSGIGDANATLAEGTNFGNAQLTANRVWTLPASAGMAVGDIVRAKAPTDIQSFKITISRAGSQTIDGYTVGIDLEADNAAISLVYAAADTWIII